MRLAQLLQFLAACAMALAALGAQARSVENVPLEKMQLVNVDCARLWMAQAVDLHQENAFIYGESVSGQTFQYFDKESNLSYNYFRSYDARTGRYTQSDPIGLEGGWNRFAYSEQNPLGYSDPRGLTSIPLPAPTVPAFTSACLANPALCGPALAGIGGYAVGTLIYPIVERPLSRAIDYCFGDSTSNGECKRQCDAQLDRDEAECLVARAGYGTRGQAVCLAKAKEYYARCLRSCDGK